VTLLDEMTDDVPTEESGRTGDGNAHGASPLQTVRFKR
jgi:hypothetical protein